MAQNSEKYFNLFPNSKYDTDFPYFRRPTEIGSFSQDSTRQFVSSRQQMKYYIPPEDPNDVCFDLKIGYKDYIRKDESKPDLLDDLLRWIISNPSVFAVKSDKTKEQTENNIPQGINTDFVCWRGLLTRLLCTPSQTSEGWKIAIIRFRDTFFLCEFDTKKNAEFKKNRTGKQDEMCYWGWKFEQYVTAGTQNGTPDTNTLVNTNEGYCTVVRSRLNSHSLVYGGEVDAAISEAGPGKPYQYVEFKTNMEIETQKQDFSFRRYKLIKWWAQSFLVGITQIVAGFRDRDGIVHRLENFNTLDIPSIAKNLRDPWKPNVCFNFLDQFLTFIKQTIVTNNHSVVHLLEWEPGCDVRCQRLEPNSQYAFLPEWFINPSNEV
ncbi:decapping and exoribonuclease protein-like [Mizuhopecten yessoensis]|uniref:Decapping nuclease n=1 Tax=Mizuhopecten yessoensis TaxID=6573 RepID=A0A210PUF9_MIZYE|nr:decapping and exoribonuclease protein-like [Mizuhopecten yessoensis]OWF40092.1 Decapping and exoribonuclease protein [Mizuhopecten yessoensis]